MLYAKSTGGFYVLAIHTAIPTDAVEITESYHAELLAAQASGKRIEPDAAGYPIAVDPPAPTLDEVKRLKIAEIELAAATEIAPITSAYPLAERDTWPIQEAEAVALTANSQASTPMLNAIAAARGQTLADVVSNVLTKAAAFKAVAGATFGKRKVKIDLVNAAATAEDVGAITWM